MNFKSLEETLYFCEKGQFWTQLNSLMKFFFF